jgi:transcriptional regulator with XRE-family HTH domain
MRLRLAELMAERRITQAQVARGLGVTRAAVSKWAKPIPESWPRPDQLEDLCLFFEVTPGEMLVMGKDRTGTGKTWRDFDSLAVA